jgi:hypothetical protein
MATRTIFEVIEAGLTTSFITNFALAAVMKLSMKRIWGIINTLQILTILPKLVKSLPSNLISCLQNIQDIVSLKLIPKPWVVSIIESMRNSINSRAGNSEKSRFLQETAGQFKSDPDSSPNLLDDIGYLVIMVGAFLLGLSGLVILLLLSKRLKK